MKDITSLDEWLEFVYATILVTWQHCTQQQQYLAVKMIVLRTSFEHLFLLSCIIYGIFQGQTYFMDKLYKHVKNKFNVRCDLMWSFSCLLDNITFGC